LRTHPYQHEAPASASPSRPRRRPKRGTRWRFVLVSGDRGRSMSHAWARRS